MNIPGEATIWRDPNDIGIFHVGAATRGTFCWWFSLPQVGITACFGVEAYARATGLEPGKPVPLKDVLG